MSKCMRCGNELHSPRSSSPYCDMCLATRAAIDPPKPTILEEAQQIVSGARNDDYGAPERNQDPIAQMWSAYLGVPVSPRDVCAMMVLVKVSRERNAPKRDNAVDIAGYAYLMDIVGGNDGND